MASLVLGGLVRSRLYHERQVPAAEFTSLEGHTMITADARTTRVDEIIAATATVRASPSNDGHNWPVSTSDFVPSSPTSVEFSPTARHCR